MRRPVRADHGRVRTPRFAAALLLALALPLSAEESPLTLGPGDLRIEERADGGYHLYIRRKPGMGSVLLTESTKDPDGHEANYAYRASEWNPVNGDEKRMLDGAVLAPEKKIWSLIDSTPEPDALFGEAFHVFIPWVVEWGYPWTRSGSTFIHDGTFVNIRAFALPYADYRGAFADNPFLVSVVQKPRAEAPAPPPSSPAPTEPPADTSIYIPQTVDAFSKIAEKNKGESFLAKGPDDIAPIIASILDDSPGGSIDLVICIDTTDSMTDDIAAVKAMVPKLVADRVKDYSRIRIGLVLYKDYFEEYVVKPYPFTTSVPSFQAAVNSIRVGGGRDLPEAVYEALYEALTQYPWAADKKMVILIGDAPPHPLPRGKIDKAMVEAEATKRGVSVNTIILPD